MTTKVKCPTCHKFGWISNYGPYHPHHYMLRALANAANKGGAFPFYTPVKCDCGAIHPLEDFFPEDATRNIGLAYQIKRFQYNHRLQSKKQEASVGKAAPEQECNTVQDSTIIGILTPEQRLAKAYAIPRRERTVDDWLVIANSGRYLDQ